MTADVLKSDTFSLSGNFKICSCQVVGGCFIVGCVPLLHAFANQSLRNMFVLMAHEIQSFSRDALHDWNLGLIRKPAAGEFWDPKTSCSDFEMRKLEITSPWWDPCLFFSRRAMKDISFRPCSAWFSFPCWNKSQLGCFYFRSIVAFFRSSLPETMNWKRSMDTSWSFHT